MNPERLPEPFLAQMKGLLAHEWPGFLSALTAGIPDWGGLRANSLKISPKALETLLPGELALSPVSWSWERSGFYYRVCQEARPSKMAYHDAGLYYLQEPSAMSAAAMLPVQEGDRVLDLCAAPGGKSTQLAAKLKGTGVLVANDVSGSRCLALGKNLERLGVANAVVTNETAERLCVNLRGWFNKVLIDAPCSGEGMFRREPDTIQGYQEHSPAHCAALQKQILAHGTALLAPGGMLLYSTCTFNPDENERMIQWFLNEHQDFSVCPIDHRRYGLSRGRADWAGNDQRLLGCARIWPHKQQGEGHFMALLQRAGQRPLDDKRQTRPPSPKPPDLAAYEAFCRDYLRQKPVGNLALRKNALYLEPFDMPDLSGIRAYKTGLYLGDLKPGRFEPSQPMALALQKAHARFTLDFPVNSDIIWRYLAGESFAVDTDGSGYHLVCADGYPLGFAKVTGGRLKNRPR